VSATLLAWLSPGLARLGIDSLQHPARLPWLLALAAAVVVLGALRRPRSLAWPAWSEARRAGARRLEAAPVLALGLRALCLGLLCVVLAGPVSLRRAPPEPGLGLDLVLALDTSGSMRALDAAGAERARTRLDLAKEVVARFASRRAAEGDRVGLVVFGATAFTQCPLTSDGRLLAAALARVEAGIAGEATALGDALALAVKRVAAAEDGAGRVVVLLTDGRSNAGAVPVDVAAELASAAGVRVHAVGIGSGGEPVPMATRPDAPGRGLRFERHDPDLPTLERIAAATGGRAFAALRSSDLAAVYAEIDALERAPRPLPPQVRDSLRAEPLLAGAGALLAAELALARLWRRRLP
jgi:Ca-activated chloride channel family protein